LLTDGGFQVEYIWPSWMVDEAIAATLRLADLEPPGSVIMNLSYRTATDRLRYAASINFHAFRI
jgi:hypothetical protein